MPSIHGNGQGVDISMKASDYLQTTTSLYKVVGMGGATTAADWTAYLANNGQTLNNTHTAYYCIGINQSYLSSGSESCNVRAIGLSKAVCAASIAAGDWVRPYTGNSTTTRLGQIETVPNGVSIGSAGHSISNHRNILGRAYQDGSTNTVISIFVNVQIYDDQLQAE